MTDPEAYVRLLELLLQTPVGVLALLFLVALVAAPVASGILQLKSNSRQTQVLSEMTRVWSALIADLVSINHKNAEALARLDDLLEAQQAEDRQSRQMMENVTTALVALTEAVGKRFDETIELVAPLPERAEQTLAEVGAVQASVQALREGQDGILQAVQRVHDDVQRLHAMVEAQGRDMAQASELQDDLGRRVERVLNEVQSLRLHIEQATNTVS